MRKPFSSLIAIVLFSQTLFAQWMPTSGPEGGPVLCVENVGDQLWAGTRGGLYISADDGHTWNLSVDVSPESTVSYIIGFGDTVLMLVSQFDYFQSEMLIRVYVRTDQTSPWTVHSTPLFDWNGVVDDFYINGSSLFAFDGHHLFVSQDLGNDWTMLNIPDEFSTVYQCLSDGNRLFLHGNKLVSSTYYSLDMYSDDGGTTWMVMNNFPVGTYGRSMWVEDNLILLSSSIPTMYRSTDFGASWQFVSWNGGGYPGVIRREADGQLVALGDKLYRSQNDGQTWFTSQMGPVVVASDMAQIGSGDFVVSTARGMYQVSNDFSQWTPSNNKLTTIDGGILFPSPEGYVYASTDQGFFVSKNAGNSWTKVVPENVSGPYEVQEMLFLGDTLVCANTSNILLSVDNGLTWVTRGIYPQIAYDFFGVEYVNGTLYAAANQLFTTTDWGQTWTIVPFPFSPGYGQCLDVLSVGNYLFLAFSSGYIRRYSLTDQSWTNSVFMSTPGLTSGYRINAINGAIFARLNKLIMFSIDEGITWQPLEKPGVPTSWANQEPVIDDLAGLGNLLFAAVNFNGVWVTGDFGQSWTPYNDGLINPTSHSLAFADSILYLSTTTGGIWRRGSAFKNVSGTIWHDDNNNGMLDLGELPYEGAIVSARPLNQYNTTPADGMYSIYAEVFNDTLRATPTTPYSLVLPPFYLVSQQADSLNFSIHTIPGIVDLCVSVTHMEPIRPGFDNSFVVTVKNVGTTETDGLVRMDIPDGLTFDGASPTPNLILGDTLQWNFTGLEPNAFLNFTVLVTASVSLMQGSAVSYAAEVQPLNDENPNNNINGDRTDVVGSYDPNDKAVSPGLWLTPEELAEGHPLTYTIRFENTGTYYAEFIRITDTLSPLLDASSLQILSSSHPCTWTLKGPGIVEFFFPDIWLPWFEPDKHGFVKFSVQPRQTLELGEVVENTGNIYFDFNPAIVTNTVGTTIGYSTATHNPEKLEVLRFQPNPAADYVRLFWANAPVGINRVRLYDLEGRCMMDEKFHQTGDWITVPLINLPNGKYMLFVEKEGRTAGGMVVVAQTK